MLIPIHVSFLDLLNGHYRLVFKDLVTIDPNFAKAVKEGVYILDNLSLVLGISKRQLMKKLKLGMKHPDIPNDKRGLVRRDDGNGPVDIVGLSYDVLNMVKFYQMERLSGKINNLHDKTIFEKLLKEVEASQSDPDPKNGDVLDQKWHQHADIDDDEISSLADYYGELTENHYGSQAIGHSMPSEKNLSLGDAIKKIIKRCTVLYSLALNDQFNVNLPMGGPNPFWLGVIMHTITDSYSTVHTYRVRYDVAGNLYYKLSADPDNLKAKDIIDPQFVDFIPIPGQLYFSKWELRSPMSLFGRCLSNYLDRHFNEFYTQLNTFNDPESLVDFVIATICQNYCSASHKTSRPFCRTCQNSYACKIFNKHRLFRPGDTTPKTNISKFSDYYIEGDLTHSAFFNLQKFSEFIVGYHQLGPKAKKVREKVVELINRLLFFKFREKELQDRFTNPGLKTRYENMISESFELDNYVLDGALPKPIEEGPQDFDSGYEPSTPMPLIDLTEEMVRVRSSDPNSHDIQDPDYSEEPDATEEPDTMVEYEVLQDGGDGLWEGFISTVGDLFSRGHLRISSAPTHDMFKYYDKEEIYEGTGRRRENQSFIIDFHDYEKQTSPPDTHMRCDYVQDPSLLREIYDNLKHLTQLYSHHINYLYKLKVKQGENINTFLEETKGDITRLGEDPEYAKEEYQSRLRKCIKEFYHFIYYWVYRISSPEATRSRIKRFSVNPETCQVDN